MRRTLLLCASIAFAIACGDSATEPVPTRTPSAPPVSFATSSSEDGLSITTDKDDYAPGDTVHLTGAGWEPGEVLDILLADDTHDSHTWSIPVGQDGTFHDSTYVVDTRDYGVTFTLIATSPTGASLTVAFTDGRDITSVTLNGTSTATVAAGAAVSAQVKGQLTGGGSNTLGSIGVKAYVDGTASSTAVQLTCYDVDPNQGPSIPPSQIAYDHTFSFNAPSPLTGTTYDMIVTSYSDNACSTPAGAFAFTINNGLTVTTTLATAFSNLSSPTITYGDTPTALTGKITAGTQIPTGSVSITLNGVTQSSTINSADGTFTSNFVTGSLEVPGSPYTITYKYAGNGSFGAAPDGTGYLTVNKAPLTVTLVSPQAIIFGDKPDYTVTYGGFVNSENASVLGGALAFTVDGNPINTATFVPSVGSHILTASGLTSANYTITYLPANGATVQVSYDFRGFFTPVDNPGPNNVMNVANSGQAIPLKWQLLDFAGNPVTDLSSATVTAVTLACATGTTIDLLEEYAAGSSGLQNLGGGFYQFNWKTPSGYAKSCKTMKLDLGEGTSHIALFQFKK